MVRIGNQNEKSKPKGSSLKVASNSKGILLTHLLTRFRKGLMSEAHSESNQISLREKYPNTEFFLVHIFLYSD